MDKDSKMKEAEEEAGEGGAKGRRRSRRPTTSLVLVLATALLLCLLGADLAAHLRWAGEVRELRGRMEDMEGRVGAEITSSPRFSSADVERTPVKVRKMMLYSTTQPMSPACI